MFHAQTRLAGAYAYAYCLPSLPQWRHPRSTLTLMDGAVWSRVFGISVTLYLSMNVAIIYRGAVAGIWNMELLVGNHVSSVQSHCLYVTFYRGMHCLRKEPNTTLIGRHGGHIALSSRCRASANRGRYDGPVKLKEVTIYKGCNLRHAVGNTGWIDNKSDIMGIHHM